MSEPIDDFGHTAWDLVECPYCRRRTLTGLCGCHPQAARARQNRLVTRQLRRQANYRPRAHTARAVAVIVLCVAAFLIGVFALIGQLSMFVSVALLFCSFALTAR